MAVLPERVRAPPAPPRLKPGLENTTTLRKKKTRKQLSQKKKKKEERKKERKKERNLLNYLAKGSDMRANSAGRHRLPEAGVGRWLSARADVAGAGGGSRVVPAVGPTSAAAVREELESLPDFHPGCWVLHVPSRCWLATAEDRAASPSRRRDVHNAAPLLRSRTPAMHRPGEQNPVEESCRAVQPRFSIASKEAQPARSFLQQPQPQMGIPKGHICPAKAPPLAPLQRPSSQGGATPFPLTCFFPIFFFRKQLTLFFEEQQMSETLPVPFMMLNLLPCFAIAFLMMNTPAALMRLECWH